MKKHRKLMVTVLVVASVGLGIYASSSLETNKILDVLLGELESLGRYELPEFVIECGSSEKKGACWTQSGCEPVYTPLGFFRVTECETFTGSMSDSCYEDLPC